MNDLPLGSICHGFRLDERAHLTEIQSTVFLLTHTVLGCKALAIKNTDSNKTFCLSFRTIPQDSTGVAHILEHAVLMGSKKYPVRDVFGEIHKGSLLTFLNAMTGPDSTYYPFATRNLREYFNIMDVYCDVCFQPLLLPSTFAQEGWHLHLEDESAGVQFMGVVFNEMKGAYADPLRSLVHNVYKGLMPGSTYAHESGGDPRVIPDLSFEQFCAFHRAHYHPSNSTLFFYGDAPLEEELAYVQDHFLSRYDHPAAPAKVVEGELPSIPHTLHDHYPVQADSDTSGKTFIAAASAVGTVQERENSLAFEIIANILFNSDASPLKAAIVSAGLGKDFGGLCMAGSSFRIVMLTYLIGSDPDKAEAFFALYRQTLANIAAQGLEHELVLSELNTFEFKVREEMNKPQRGLQLIMRVQTAMKHGISPFEALCVDELLAQVRHKALNERWFESLIHTHLLDNPASVQVILEPDPSGMEASQKEEQHRLDSLEQALSTEGRKQLVQKTLQLMELQATPPTDAELACLPRLSLGEMEARPRLHSVRVAELAGRPFLVNELAASGVVYVDIGLDCSALTSEDLLYLDLFGTIITEIGTSTKNYMQFAKEASLYTGDFTHSFHVYTKADSPDAGSGVVQPVLWLHVKALAAYLPQAMDLVAELLADVDFSDRRRIEEIVRREFAWAEHNAQSEGYGLASLRAFSLLSLPGQYRESVQGISAYQQLKQLAENYSILEEEFLTALLRIRSALFRRPGLTCAITADAAEIERFSALGIEVFQSLHPEAAPAQKPQFTTFPATHAFTTAAEVVYNVQTCRLFTDTAKYSGDFEVLKTWLSRDYLWNTVRQMGGAYGCFTQFNHITGDFGLVSYRDPQVAKTYSAYADLPQVVAKLDLSPTVLEQVIIGAYSSVNPHQGPAAKGALARDQYLSGVTVDFLQKRVESILNANMAGLRRYAELFAPLAKDPVRVSVGNGDKISRDASLFARIDAL
ncbi:MAG: peptidase M16 [Desulfobulbaceae bacterium]|nr:peptidase M16 [Desulfobulbaceae bacterium]